MTTIAYDVAGQLVSVTDADNHVTSVQYDGLGRKRVLVDPDLGTSTFTLDANGNLLRQSSAAGMIDWDGYDDLDRPTLRRVGGVVDGSFTYDTAPGGLGLLHTREDGARRYTVTGYTVEGRPAQERIEPKRAGAVIRAFNLATTYDALGQTRTETNVTTGRVTRRVYDSKGWLTSIDAPSAAQTWAHEIAWDAEGRLTKWKAGNDVQWSMTSETGTGRPDVIEVLRGTAETLESLDFEYDAGDRIAAISDDGPVGLPNRSFQYDAVNRLTEAVGPYGAGLTSATLRFGYDTIGNLRCKDADAASDTSCTPGTLGRELVYPGTSTAIAGYPARSLPHAPSSVTFGGTTTPVEYDAAARMKKLGTREYTWTAAGHLSTAREGGKIVADYNYDSTGTRVRSVDRTGRRAITRHDVTSTLEWDETRAMVWTHVRLGGRAIATRSDPLGAPVNTPGGTLAAAALAAPSLRSGPRLDPRTLAAIVFAPTALLALALLLELERRRQKGLPLTKSVLASTTLVAFFTMMSSEAHAAGAALSGDLNGDARLDAGDALIATLIARGARTATPSELSAGDVAPLNVAPTTPSAINAADLLLIERALRGEDVDGDTISTTSELTNGTSPFRADTDRDGLRDDVELAYGTHPAQSDADGDGLTDAAEIAAGSDPEDRDTDGDGWLDGVDTDPRGGVVYRHGDHLGSTTLTTRSDAQVIARAVYRPFGGVVPASAGSPTHAPGEFGFTGQRYEKASGIYDYGARFYDPALGRFLTPDTVVPGGGLDPQGLNRYAYVRNNPMSYVDPSGMFWQELWGGVTGFFGSAFSSAEQWIGGGGGGAFGGFQQGLRDYLPGAIASPLAGLAGIVGGAGQMLFGAFTADPSRIVGGAQSMGLGALESIGLREAFTERWVNGQTGGFLPQSLNGLLARAEQRNPSDAPENGMHAWHAASNAALANRLGPGGAAAQILGGIIHEMPLDWDSFSIEQTGQGTVNHFLDSSTDLVANIFGQTLGYLLPGGPAESLARSLGNRIPGPTDPDPRGEGPRQPYAGRPIEKWGPYR